MWSSTALIPPLAGGKAIFGLISDVRLLWDVQRSGFRDQVGWSGQTGNSVGEADLPARMRSLRKRRALKRAAPREILKIKTGPSKPCEAAYGL
jgi:hypothetical protein